MELGLKTYTSAGIKGIWFCGRVMEGVHVGEVKRLEGGSIWALGIPSFDKMLMYSLFERRRATLW